MSWAGGGGLRLALEEASRTQCPRQRTQIGPSRAGINATKRYVNVNISL